MWENNFTYIIWSIEMDEDYMLVVILVMVVLTMILNVLECIGNWANSIRSSTCCGGTLERVVVQGESNRESENGGNKMLENMKNYVDLINGQRGDSKETTRD